MKKTNNPIIDALPGLATAVAIGVFLMENWQLTEQIDDAYISFQYARNLVAGHGLVFNIGERVEGFTNLTWTLLIALGMKLGFDAALFCHSIGLLFSALLLVATAVYAAILLPPSRRWLAGLAPLLLLASNSFVGWSTAGLEAPLFAVLITAAFCCAVKESWYAVAVWCALATLTRPEGALYAAVLLGAGALIQAWQCRGSLFVELMKHSGAIIVYLLFLVIYTTWRLYYYGEYLPNTFYAKAGGIPLVYGLKYVWNFIADGSGVLLIPAVIATLLRRDYRLTFAAIFVTLIYVIAIGGDAFHLSRFLLPVLPVIIGGGLIGVDALLNRNRELGIALFAVLPLSAAWSLWGKPLSAEYFGAEWQRFPTLSKRISAKNHAAFGGVAAARKLADDIASLSPPAKSVATIAIGQLAFFSNDLHVIDLVGLVDKHISRSKKRIKGKGVLMLPGHQRTDSEYVLDCRPDVIVIPKKGTAFPFYLPAISDLWRNERLEAMYAWDEKKQFYVLKSRAAGADEELH